MQINNLLDAIQQGSIHKSNSKKVYTTSIKKSFADALSNCVESRDYEKKSNQDYTKKDSSKLYNAKVFNLNKDTVSLKGLKLLSKLDQFLSRKTDVSDVKECLKSLQNILFDIKSDVADKTENLESDSDMCIEEFDEETMIQQLIALLSLNSPTDSNQLSDNVEGSISISLLEGASTLEEWIDFLENNPDLNDVDAAELIDSIENTLDSIDEKLSDFLSSLESNGGQVLESGSEIIGKLLELALNSDGSVENTIVSSSKKEDIQLNINNLDISPILTNSLNGGNFNIDKASTIHPIARQVLENVQDQLSSLHLDNKTIELRLKLFPSRLGGISIVIEKSGNSLNVKLLSDNPEVRNVLVESIQDLKFELDKSNQNEVHVDVSSEQSENNRKNNKEENINTGLKDVDSYMEEVALKFYTHSTLTDKILDITI